MSILSKPERDAYERNCHHMPKEDFLKEMKKVQFVLKNHTDPVLQLGITLRDRMKAEEKMDILIVIEAEYQALIKEEEDLRNDINSSSENDKSGTDATTGHKQYGV